MAGKPMKILMLVDLLVPPPWNGDYAEFLEREEWKLERELLAALGRLGHEVKIFGLFDDIHPLIAELKNHPPDVVFNLCEAFRADRKFEPHVVNLLELMGTSYTGAGPTSLRICKDKGLTKKILAYHHIRVPRFIVSKKSQPVKSLKDFPYPAFVKPLAFEGSEGIAQGSLCESEKVALERVKYLHESLESDVIVEEFIDGRELYVGIMGNDRLTVFPPRELFFENVPKGEPTFATFKAKWDEKYRKRWGIDSGPAKKLPIELSKEIADVCKRVYRFFHLRGYARIDLRVTPDGHVVVIEANPNPSIGADEDFAQSALSAGIDYDELISRIIGLAGHEA